MQSLRDRFQPETGANKRDFASGGSSPAPRTGSKDYFNYVPPSPTVKAPSLPSTTPKVGMTPGVYDPRCHTAHPTDLQPLTTESPETTESLTQVSPPRASMFSPDTATRQSSTYVRRHSALRKQVAAGDLAMTRAKEDEKYYYRAAPTTPGLPRMDTWRGRAPLTSRLSQSHNGLPVSPDSDLEDDEHFDLKSEVVVCIAKSIGLSHTTQTPDTGVRGSVASPSVLSTPNSPMFPANAHNRSTSRAPFGNVLDMMNASHSEGQLGGMLREAVMTARLDEDASSISMSVPESSVIGGGTGDAMRGVLREMSANLEILYFNKGSVLVKEGERAPGLYYVIDGFLDVSFHKQYG